MGVPVDPLIHAESCPPVRDTQCHAQSHVVHMHNRYAAAAYGGYPQYPQGLLTLLTPFFLFIQITSPLPHPNHPNVPKPMFWSRLDSKVANCDGKKIWALPRPLAELDSKAENIHLRNWASPNRRLCSQKISGTSKEFFKKFSLKTSKVSWHKNRCALRRFFPRQRELQLFQKLASPC